MRGVCLLVSDCIVGVYVYERVCKCVCLCAAGPVALGLQASPGGSHAHVVQGPFCPAAARQCGVRSDGFRKCAEKHLWPAKKKVVVKSNPERHGGVKRRFA